MATSRSDRGAAPVSRAAPPRRLRRLLHRHAASISAIDKAESEYRDVVLVESLRHGGKMKRASCKRVDAAFEALVDAVIDLQTAQIETLSLTRNEGLPPEAAGALDEATESVARHYAGYLAARTYDQVREAAAQRTRGQ